jgi:hypothetical protein
MKKLSVFAMTASLLAFAPMVHAGYFYVTEKTVKGSPSVSTSITYSTLSACESKAQAATNLIQDCVSSCDPANPKSEYFLEQVTNGSYQGFGPYGFQMDCEAGIEDAAAAGMTNVMTTCTFVAAKTKCR